MTLGSRLGPVKINWCKYMSSFLSFFGTSDPLTNNIQYAGSKVNRLLKVLSKKEI